MGETASDQRAFEKLEIGDKVIDTKHFILRCKDNLSDARQLFAKYGGSYVFFCRDRYLAPNPTNDPRAKEEMDEIGWPIEHAGADKLALGIRERDWIEVRNKTIKEFKAGWRLNPKLVWAGENDTPEIDRVDEIVNFHTYTDAQLYKDRVARLKPDHVFNVARSDEELAEWKALLKNEGIAIEAEVDVRTEDGILTLLPGQDDLDDWDESKLDGEFWRSIQESEMKS